jgi:protein-S-isoprenylcysteine O-methyltransferase Ste14
MVAVEVFQPGLAAALYGTVSLAWVASFLLEGLIIRSGGQKSAEVRSDKGSGVLIIVSIFGSISIADVFAASGFTILPVESLYLGLAMMVMGMGFRLWAVATLRSFFSYTVQIKTGHRVIQSGPYRFVRHPAYAGTLLTLVGVGFALQSWGAVLLIAFVFTLVFGYRIRVEEQALAGSLGEEYLSYARKVKRLIPFIF